MDSKQIIMYLLLTTGIFILIAPKSYQIMIPIQIDTSTRQIIAIFAILLAYYYYNGEKFL